MDNIKTINDLLNCNFFIPSYQRGYRWTEQLVTDLLDDVWEFANRPNKKDNEWYCIQPVVVVKTDDDTKNKNCLIGDWYDVIDGQQRLTTTFLILKYLGFDVENGRKNFQIKYETRKDSESFLTEINNKSEADSYKNVDFYHIFQSFQAIKKWFENNKDVDEKIFSKTFIKKVNAIWYETIDSNSIDIFTRINSGKIPLTNAELIKALFLCKWYPRKDLSSKLQTKLKFRGTFLNLTDFKSEIDALIESGFAELKESYSQKIEQEREENIRKIAAHINKRANTYFQDIEFEKFILELFKLTYNGFEGFKNNQRQEAEDGKDLCLTYAIDELDIIVELNIQVKQHSSNASFEGVFQINKSINENTNVLSRNILVTSGSVNEEFKSRALEKGVYVYGPEDIAKMILDNISDLSSTFLQKLNITNQLVVPE